MYYVIIVISFAALVGVALLLYMFREAHLNIVLTKDIHIKDLPKAFDHFSIYFISDVHKRIISTKMLDEVVDPDIVIIGGDLMEEGVPFSQVLKNVESLTRFNVPILFVWGNHDLFVNRERLKQILIQNGVIILENNVFHIEKNGHTLNLVGVGDSTNELDQLDDAISYCEKGVRILLSHNPNITEKIQEVHQIPLVISGHTHGGQIRLFGWGIREKGGVWTKPFGTLIISNGYGTTSYPLRLGAPPDSLFIRLHP